MPRNKYPEETVQKILDVSQKLFLEKGYEETTVLDIVSNLGGLTRGAFYHHFKSKEDVLNALGDKMFFENNPFDKVKNDPTLNGLEKAKKAIKLNFQNEEQQEINLMSIPILDNPRIFVDFLKNNQTIGVPYFEEFFKEGMEDGSIQTKDASMARPLAEMLMILSCLWFVPTVFPCTKEELWVRINFTKTLYESFGIPLLDEEIMEYIKTALKKLDFA